MANAGDYISRFYSGFRGVDFRGDEVNLVRSPDSVNIWKDYKETDSIRTRPGMVLNTSFPSPVYGIFFFNNTMLVHSGKNLYTVSSGGKKTIIFSDANETVSDSFIYENVLYFKDGKNYLQYDGITIKEVEGYVPTTSIGRKPSGGGVIYEDVNYLTGMRKNTFLADGESKEFVLDAMNIDTDFPPLAKVNGEVADVTIDFVAGKVIFSTAPEKPLTDGQDNVMVQFKKTVSGYADRIKKCTLLQVFDNRVFFSGNEDYPNMIFHCSLDDPSYCSDLDYYNEGLDNAAVKGLVAGNNALWVFREPSQSNATVFYHTPTIDSDYGKIYPSTHSNVTTGCVGKAINFNDDIVFFSDRGMEGISGDVTTEQVLGHRSSLVDSKLLSEPNYKEMVLAEWEGYLIVFVGDKAYLADSRATFTNNSLEYDWFYWDLGKKVNCARVNDGILYVGTDDGVYTLTDNECDVESYWVTPKDKFKNPNKQKTTNKKSCTVEAEGEEISVYAKSNRDKDFVLLGTFNDVKDAFNCRIKVKKFKDIQLKFYSSKRFALESATLECIIGGYLKNL
jgi:hypothetical protein